MKKIENEKIKFEKIIEVIVYVAFATYMAFLMYECTLLGIGKVTKTIDTIKQICMYVFMFKILYDGIRKKQIPIMVVTVLIVSYLIYAYTKNYILINLLIIIVAIRECDLKELLRMVALIYSMIFGLIIFASLVNVIPDWIYMRKAGTERHSLGFYYPTIMMGFYITIILMYSYIRKSKASYIELFFLQVINYFLYSYSDARLGFILITAVLIIMLLSKILKNKKEKIKSILNKEYIKNLCYIIPLILLIVMMLATYLYSTNNKIGIYLNKLLSDRLDLNYNALNRYEIGLWGTKIKWNRMGILWISYTGG